MPPGAPRPAHLDLDYFEQLVAEKVKITYRGGNARRDWVLPAVETRLSTHFLSPPPPLAARAARHSMSVDYDARRDWLAETEVMPSLGDVAKLFS